MVSVCKFYDKCDVGFVFRTQAMECASLVHMYMRNICVGRYDSKMSLNRARVIRTGNVWKSLLY